MRDKTLTIVGLGPADLEMTSEDALRLLNDSQRTVIVRTERHPAAAALAGQRDDVVFCDDIYDSAPDLDTVYHEIAARVVAAVAARPTVYAVPGSPFVGERSVSVVRAMAADAGVVTTVVAAVSFLDLVWDRAGIDPITEGAQVLDGRDLPDPMPLHIPTVITQVDRPLVIADVATTLARVLSGDQEILVLDRLGDQDEIVTSMTLADLPRYEPGPRTSLYLDPPLVGWHGLVVTNRRLRLECPWDQEQTHHTLLTHLIEETYETVDALTALSPEAPGGVADHGAYAHLEEELGDLLLQVVFHATLAREAGAFDVEEVAETIRRKLVARHPHVFGDVEAGSADEVLANWEQSKHIEKARDSLMDDVPASLPAVARADKVQRRAAAVGFDWTDFAPVIAKLDEELEELRAVVGDDSASLEELGDLLFATVNVARHLGLDAEVALRGANEKFESRFRHMETAATSAGSEMSKMTLEELDALWEDAKHELRSR